LWRRVKTHATYAALQGKLVAALRCDNESGRKLRVAWQKPRNRKSQHSQKTRKK